MCSMHEDLSDTTPNKKRKRSSLNNYISSTPDFTTKGSRDFIFDNPGLDLCTVSPKTQNRVGKNGYNVAESCMEIKSISDLVVKDQFEVVRKPPKKKKRVHDIEENCFVNEGLNLNLAEKNPVNPFEVKRPNENVSNDLTHCFVNSGLNIRGPESNINPFEVARGKPTLTKGDLENTGIDNLGLEVQPSLSLALPFTPTINRRIHFKNVSPSILQSPSALLAKALVFSPEENKSVSINRVCELSVISEEPLDIDKELDHYQLELENSINEAKTRNKTCRSLMDIKQISNLALKIKNFKEDHETDETDDKSSTFIIEIKSQETRIQTTEVIHEHAPQQSNKNNISEVEDVEGVQYEEVNEEDDSRVDDDFDFKDPAPFKRAFRRSMRAKDQEQEKPQKENMSHSHNFMKDIRKSIRKLIHHSKGDDIKKTEQQSNESHHGLLSTIRQSFRRKPKIAENNQKLDHDVSIIDETVKRQIFRQPEADAEGNMRKSRRQKKIYF